MNAQTHTPRKLRLLAVFAHPDDETFCAGGTLAHHVGQGGEAMVVSFTQGQRGQIRDPAAASRRTLGAVREREFYLACERLGVQTALCLDYMDGSLAELDPQILVDEVLQLFSAFRPDIVLTFNREGGYGHPDHIAVSKAVTHAFGQTGSSEGYPEHHTDRLTPHTPSRLYHSVFVRQDRLLAEELATWLRDLRKRYHASAAFVSAMPLLASAVTTMGYARDDVQTQWYPPGVSILEPGEVGDSLYLILSGHVDLVEERDDGCGRVITRKGPGEFLGAVSFIDRRPSQVHAVSAGGVTCLVLARERPSLHRLRGTGAQHAGAMTAGAQEDLDDGRGTMAIDVSPYVERKLAAIRAHRTQYPIAPNLLPASILQRLLGTEYFLRVSPSLSSETAFLDVSGDGAGQGQAA